MTSTFQFDRIFKAFADPTRLRIMHVLTRGELCVCDIMSILKTRQPKVSRHLAYLRGVGLVRGRKDGLWVHYSLAGGGIGKRLLNCLKGCFLEVPVLKNDITTLTRLRSRKAACR